MNIAVTFFADQFAASKTEQSLALDDLAHRIETTTRPDKYRLPWLKLARFGDIITDKNSLRWDGNMLAITGVELDYDGEHMSIAVVVAVLRAIGLLAIAYTSPSHSPSAPRWRVLCPCAQEWPPDHRDRLLARLNGLLGGIASPESWTRSQSYYFGSVNRNPAHRVALLDGTPVDQMAALDALAIGRPPRGDGGNNEKAGKGQNGDGVSRHHQLHGGDPAPITDKRIAGQIAALLANVGHAPEGQKHYTLLRNGRALGGYLHLAGWTDEQAVEALMAALPDTVKDWVGARRTAAWAVAKGRKEPQTLPDREWSGWRRSA